MQAHLRGEPFCAGRHLRSSATRVPHPSIAPSAAQAAALAWGPARWEGTQRLCTRPPLMLGACSAEGELHAGAC